MSSPLKSSRISSRWCRPALWRCTRAARGSRRLEFCDRVVFDLDPGEGVTWKEIVAAARETRERLKAEKLESFVKLSGGKGVHVVVPIDDADWDTTKVFTQRIALAMAADSPQRYVGKMTKSLRKGKHLHRLFPQLARGDVGRALFDARPPRRFGFRAGILGPTRPHHRRQRVHRAQSEKALQERSVGRHRQGAAEAACQSKSEGPQAARRPIRSTATQA